MLRNRVSAGFLIAVMIGVTIWSGVDGKRSAALIAVACLGIFAAMMVLGTIMAMLPETRLTAALFSATWITLFTPVWEWLAGRFVYPGSIQSALGFGALFGLIRYLFTPGGSSRPPS